MSLIQQYCRSGRLRRVTVGFSSAPPEVGFGVVAYGARQRVQRTLASQRNTSAWPCRKTAGRALPCDFAVVETQVSRILKANAMMPKANTHTFPMSAWRWQHVYHWWPRFCGGTRSCRIPFWRGVNCTTSHALRQCSGIDLSPTACPEAAG